MKPILYVQQQLASTGFALIQNRIATELRPDLFPNGLHAAAEFGEARQCGYLGANTRDFRGPLVQLYATIEGYPESVELLTRSENRLAERIHELTGYVVTGIQAHTPVQSRWAAGQEEDARQQARQAAQIRQKKLDKLRALAGQEVPVHLCPQRTEILRARKELADSGEAVNGFVPA